MLISQSSFGQQPYIELYFATNPNPIASYLKIY